MKSHEEWAVYSPSVSAAYLKCLTDPQEKHRRGDWPSGLTPEDLNFLNPDCPLFHHNAILMSPGQYLGEEDALRKADIKQNASVTIVGDSLGFQFIDRPELWRGKETLDEVLELQEEFFDVATIVDIPSRIVTKGYPRFKNVTDCRDITFENGRYFEKRRTPGAVKHLNVIQGQNDIQAFQWYEVMKPLELEGYAFGGYCRLDLHFLLRLIHKMLDDQVLEKVEHLHFLGTGTLSSALALTILKQEVDRLLSKSIPFTFDTSTPFRQAMQNYQAFGYPKFNPNSLTVPMYKAPRSREYFGSKLPFPYQTSAISRRLTCGDLCVKNENIQSHAWDTLSGVLVANHNIDTAIQCMDQARLLFALEREEAERHLPSWLLNLKEVIPKILQTEEAGALLKRHKEDLQKLSGVVRAEEDAILLSHEN